MKSFLLSVIVVSFVLYSCNDDDDGTTIIPSPQPLKNINEKKLNNLDFFPSDSSNYWIYEYYEIDTLGNERYLGVDTMTVRLEELNGKKYIVYNQVNFLPSSRRVDLFYKDSSEYIVNQKGLIQFSATVIDSIFYIDSTTAPQLFHAEHSMIKESMKMIIKGKEIMDFLTFQFKMITKHQPALVSDTIRYSHNRYKEGIGLVLETYFFFSSPNHIERRLIDYKVKE